MQSERSRKRPPKTRKMKIPMEIRVGDGCHNFVTLEDVYNECLDNPKYFDELDLAVAPVRAANPTDPDYQAKKRLAESRLAAVLLSNNQILPERCFCTLFEKLTKQRNVDAARQWLNKGLSWKRSKISAKKLDKEAKRKPKDRKGKGEYKDNSDDSGGCHWDDCPDPKSGQ